MGWEGSGGREQALRLRKLRLRFGAGSGALQGKRQTDSVPVRYPERAGPPRGTARVLRAASFTSQLLEAHSYGKYRSLFICLLPVQALRFLNRRRRFGLRQPSLTKHLSEAQIGLRGRRAILDRGAKRSQRVGSDASAVSEWCRA